MDAKAWIRHLFGPDTTASADMLKLVESSTQPGFQSRDEALLEILADMALDRDAPGCTGSMAGQGIYTNTQMARKHKPWEVSWEDVDPERQAVITYDVGLFSPEELQEWGRDAGLRRDMLTTWKLLVGRWTPEEIASCTGTPVSTVYYRARVARTKVLAHYTSQLYYGWVEVYWAETHRHGKPFTHHRPIPIQDR